MENQKVDTAVWYADGVEVCRHWSLGCSASHAPALGLPARRGVLPARGSGAAQWPSGVAPHGPQPERGHDQIPGQINQSLTHSVLDDWIQQSIDHSVPWLGSDSVTRKPVSWGLAAAMHRSNVVRYQHLAHSILYIH